jgi:N-acetylmuramoyl-L-alanine amidase
MPAIHVIRALSFGLLCILLAGQANAAQHRSSGHRPAAQHRTKVAQNQKHVANTRASNNAPSDDRPLIVIDPGHGGRDPGAIGASGTLEKTVTLATALELRHVLAATGRYRVVLTRTGDQTVSLAARLGFARRQDADLLIAIHADASPDRAARGASVYVSSGAPTAPTGSATLQFSMIEQLEDDVRMVGAPARAAHLYVLGERTIPSVLLEMGFLSNRQDESLLRRPAHRHVLVEAIRDAIGDYFANIKGPRA